MSLPTSFKDLQVGELRRAAVEDFAVPVNTTDGKAVVLAALVEGGVTWEDYLAQHPDVRPEETVPTVENPAAPNFERTTEPDRGAVVSTTDLSNEPVSTINKVEPVTVLVQPETPVFQPNTKVLLKMYDRANPLFEIRGYRFTQSNPYALVSPEDSDYILTHETGFRQALHSELAEFYG